MSRKLLFASLIALSMSPSIFAVNYSYKFLDMDMTPYQAIFGPSFVAAPISGSYFANPSLTTSEKELILSVNSYLAGIKYGQVAVGAPFGAFYMNFLNSGKIPKLDQNNNFNGYFQVNFITIGGARKIKKINDRLSVGASGNITYRNIDDDFSLGLSVNGGASYVIPLKPDLDLNLGIALKNIGIEVKKFRNTPSSMPSFKVQSGAFLSFRNGSGIALGAEYSIDGGANIGFGVNLKVQKYVFLQWGYSFKGLNYHVGAGRDILAGMNFGIKLGEIKKISLVYAYSPMGALGDVHRLEVIYNQ